MDEREGSPFLPSQEDITRLLEDLKSGKDGAEEALFPLLYEELRSLARKYMSRERSDHTLQTTALVHEAYLRLSGAKGDGWADRAHYFRVAAQAMRRILPGIRACHDKYKKDGRVEVQVTVKPDGSAGTRLRGAFVGTPTGFCVLGQVQRARFPRFSGRAFTFTYPFVLE